ncbi:hypothetical protein C8F04DRAFT_1359133 [Mycena alexandri]|uniref:Uncharacterized protein n=1 Tax=Mycena alexandri TaxID=1745969 RepID=A0AAD6SQT6_9AGAR|nr:hypothetical protein C8F04DRAFT_1359133 [Mycena alexandri]
MGPAISAQRWPPFLSSPSTAVWLTPSLNNEHPTHVWQQGRVSIHFGVMAAPAHQAMAKDPWDTSSAPSQWYSQVIYTTMIHFVSPKLKIREYGHTAPYTYGRDTEVLGARRTTPESAWYPYARFNEVGRDTASYGAVSRIRTTCAAAPKTAHGKDTIIPDQRHKQECGRTNHSMSSNGMRQDYHRTKTRDQNQEQMVTPCHAVKRVLGKQTKMLPNAKDDEQNASQAKPNPKNGYTN